MEVELLVKVLSKGPKQKGGKYKYLLYTETGRGPHTVKEIGCIEECSTGHHLMLRALEEALGRMLRPSWLNIYLDDRYVASAFLQNWIENWQENGWVNAKGKAVADVETWQRILELLKKHKYEIHWSGEEEYHEWFEWMMGED